MTRQNVLLLATAYDWLIAKFIKHDNNSNRSSSSSNIYFQCVLLYDLPELVYNMGSLDNHGERSQTFVQRFAPGTTCFDTGGIRCVQKI